MTNSEGILVARTDYPTQYDRDLSRGALIAGALSGEQTSGAWLDDAAGRLFMAVATPLAASRTASPQGVLVAAYALDDSLAQTVKQATGSDVVFLALDTLNRPYVVASTLPRDQIEPALIADSSAIRELASREPASDSTGRQLAAVLGGEHLLGLAGPIRSAGGDVYGAFVPFRSRDAELAGFRALRRTVMRRNRAGGAAGAGARVHPGAADRAPGAAAGRSDPARAGRRLRCPDRREVR